MSLLPLWAIDLDVDVDVDVDKDMHVEMEGAATTTLNGNMSLGGDLALAKRKMARQTIWTELRPRTTVQSAVVHSPAEFTQ
ncbi:GD24262 [Drosophila simulans]|uniref:GD24262 n=1 Tax=Drosophila simulans TaxID=7240 RepID=B4Q3E3_DROSI|nr:GD24262 [Drosophila simulans]